MTLRESIGSLETLLLICNSHTLSHPRCTSRTPCSETSRHPSLLSECVYCNGGSPRSPQIHTVAESPGLAQPLVNCALASPTLSATKQLCVHMENSSPKSVPHARVCVLNTNTKLPPDPLAVASPGTTLQHALLKQRQPASHNAQKTT